MKNVNKRVPIYLENIAIFLIIVSALANISLSLTKGPNFLMDIGEYYGRFSNYNVAIHLLLRRTMGLILLMVSYNLYKRRHLAWIITVVVLVVFSGLRMVRMHAHFGIFAFLEIFVLITLVLCRKDFCKKSDNTSVKTAFLMAGCSFGLFLINTIIGFFMMRGHFYGMRDFTDCFLNSIKILFFMDTSPFAVNKVGTEYANFSIVLNWFCIILGLYLLLKPLIYNPIITKNDKLRARELVHRYGQNPISNLALEPDKKYFFSEDGVIAFGLVSDVAVCCGDIICPDDKSGATLSEFMDFCKKNTYSIVMINVTEKFLELYKSMGFEAVKYGEDAQFKLSQYNLTGGKVAKVRAAINHANVHKIKVSEYKPTVKRNIAIERQINEISREWLALKKSGELGFMVGSVGLNEPGDKRYFFATDKDGVMLGFVVFIPFECKNGYLADVTRRKKDAPQGVIEKLIYDAFMVFKEEGVEWGSMGLIPLYNVREENEKVKFTTKLLEYTYENLNALYGFKQLHHSKAKYAPTHWLPRYMVYYPKVFTPKMAYAIVRVRLPDSLKSAIVTTVKKNLNKEKRDIL